jgi:hypothetical protein
MTEKFMGLHLARAFRTGLSLAGLLALAALATSCEKKSPVVPSDGTGVEGVASESQLIAWRDTPTQDSIFADLGNPGPSHDDTLISTSEIYYAGPGKAQGMIFDYTNADRFEMFRRESGAFRPFKDFLVTPVKRLFKGHADVFRFLDVPPGGVSQDYIGRGLMDGAGAAEAPKTNLATSGTGRVAMDLQYTGPTGFPPDFRPVDSLLVLEWAPVPNAAGYWVHVYQLTNQGGEEIVLSGTPAPMYVDVTRDYLLVFLPGTTTTYRWGDTPPAGGRLLTSTPLLNGLDYLVRVVAVDANGQMISYTGTSGSYGVFRQETSYRKFPLGAVIVHPNRPAPGPGASEPSLGIPTLNPRLTIYPTGVTPHR